MDLPKEEKKRISFILILTIVIASLGMGVFVGYWTGYMSASNRIADLQSQFSKIQEQIADLQATPETPGYNQSDILEKIDVFQSQLSGISDQIDNLQAYNIDGQDNDEIMKEIGNLQSQISTLQQQITNFKATTNVIYENVTYFWGENASLSQLFEQVRESVVVIEVLASEINSLGHTVFVTVQGSGFVSNSTGQMVILTNNHVIDNAVNINVTFSNGNTYTASLEGSNPNTDVAVLTTNAPQNEYTPLIFVSSSSLKVGDLVIVVGTPYGLAGSMSNGIISALNRTITVDQTTITNIIQTTAPLNPGNSGGPLMNYQGQVVGMATAIVQDSQGIGLAIPSDTILQDITEIMSPN